MPLYKIILLMFVWSIYAGHNCVPHNRDALHSTNLASGVDGGISFLEGGLLSLIGCTMYSVGPSSFPSADIPHILVMSTVQQSGFLERSMPAGLASTYSFRQYEQLCGLKMKNVDSIGECTQPSAHLKTGDCASKNFLS